MEELLCAVCGGQIEVNSTETLGTCLYCGTVNTISANYKKKQNLFNKATHLRLNRDFHRSMKTYEKLLDEDHTDAEAHWGLVLSRYGIEYVKDNKSGEYLPTLHRMQNKSILSDIDYKDALTYARPGARRIYEERAHRIDDIYKKYETITRNEPSYDVFICYKETDENTGKHTKDSVFAHEIYTALTREGLKVFFARKTLEGKLGLDFEPLIFSALNSAKVMVVVATSLENVNAVWVRNEWERYLELCEEENSDKNIIPVYYGITAYDLPDELSSKQSLNMENLGFMQDLLDGIKKLSQRKENGKFKEMENGGDSRLVQNAATYLKLNNYEMADETYTQIIKEYPEDYRGWWGKIICSTRGLVQVTENERQVALWFSYVKKLASQDEFMEIEKEYCQHLKKVAERKAENDIRRAEQIIEQKREEIERQRQEMQELEIRKENLAKTFSNAMSEEELEKEKCNKNLLETKRRLSDRERNRKMSLLIGVISVIFLFIVFNNQFLGKSLGTVGELLMCLGITGTCLAVLIFCTTEKKAVLESKLSEVQAELNDQLKKMEDKKKMQDSQIVAEEEHINKKEKEILENVEKAKKCINYIGYGKEKLSAMHYAKECNKIDINIEIAKEISDCRKIIFDREGEDYELSSKGVITH